MINLARSSTKEANALLSLGFKGVGPSRGFNPLKPTRDERRENLETSIEGLKKLISFSDYVLPLKAEISRLEVKDPAKDKEVNEVLNNIWVHASRP